MKAAAAAAAAMPMMMVVLLVFASTASAAIDCAAEIEKMQPCLSFVENEVSVPSSDCCKGLLDVHLHSPVCLCQLLDYKPGSSSMINVTHALLLPQICNVHTNASRCPELLNAVAPAPRSSSSASPVQSSGKTKTASEASLAAPRIAGYSKLWLLPVLLVAIGPEFHLFGAALVVV